MTSPKSLSVNTPYEPPPTHWQQGAGTSLNLVDGRRPAAYEVFDTRNNTKRTEELKLVNRIRERVQEGRGADYPGITQVTRGLLEHWQEHEARTLPLYFCQIEAIKTLIWGVEATARVKTRLLLVGEDGPWGVIYRQRSPGH